MIIPIDKPTLKRKDMAAVLQTMVDDSIGPGIYSSDFLTSLSTLLHTTSYSIALRSYVDALYYSLKSLNLAPQSIVGVTSLSPYIYTTVIERLQLKVHIIDIDPLSKSYNEIELNQSLNSIDALLVYEPYGLISPIDFTQINIPVIVDISQSISSGIEDEMREGIDIVILSFEMNDIMSTGGGAAIIINTEEYVNTIKGEITSLYPYIGLSDLNSALGIIQIANLPALLNKRRDIYTLYTAASGRNRHELFAKVDIDYNINAYSFLLTIDGKVEQAIQFAKKYEVSTQLAFSHTVIKDRLGSYELYPVAIPIVERTIRFPLYPFLSATDVKKIERVISQLP
jgi:perosamine synthetase